ncbi:MAG: DUF1707 and DUF2154 domain-containing protein [Bernardetiaceae bacterium]|nr:DUF1707 and DUF2154 domain-containing protein [Bernardetiaceae bacterium]
MSKTVYGLPKKREEVLEALQTAYSSENLDIQAYEQRLQEAMEAESVEDLALVIYDFPTEIKHAIFLPLEEKENLYAVQNSESIREVAQISPIKQKRTILSTEKLKIQNLAETSSFYALLSTQKINIRECRLPNAKTWHIHVNNLLSTVVLDLRNEALDGKHIIIHVEGALGNINILLPCEGVINKEAEMIAGTYTIKDKKMRWINYFSAKDSNKERSFQNFTLTIKGRYWLGDIKISY